MRGGRDPDELPGGALPAPSGEVYEISFVEGDLKRLRGAVAGWAREQQLEPTPAEELVLAVNELATNSIRYGGGRGTLRMWREGGELMCEVSDGGRIVDPLVGRVRPEVGRSSGRGLWIVNQLCDMVQIRSSPAGTAIRIHKLLDG
jgi:anti-sigma regulatory factor (Ser/Thr protein kinase)